MEGDKFVSTAKNINQNFFAEEDDNFFAQPDGFASKLPKQEALKHLNDYDYNILREDAYKDVTDEIFKLEYKISKTEKEIQELENQIQTAAEIKDYPLANTLNTRKIQLESDLKELTSVYNELSLSAKISDNITSKIKNRVTAAQRAFGKLGGIVLSKLPNKVSSFIEIKNSLAKLENINKSVDELMNAQYPYGEAEDKYNQLSRYIARANTIQAEISKFIK